MPGALSGVPPELEASLRRDLDAVEELLRESTTSAIPYIAEVSGHLVQAGGKRFRPLLTLLAARFGDSDRPQVRTIAAVQELTHLATLYHDDVMDEAPLRRGAPSANSRYGNSMAILTGDLLFARASLLLSELDPEVGRIQARTFERLVTGQLRETVGPADGEDPIEHYLSVVADKTGSLIAACGRLGALVAGAEEGTVEVLTRFGEQIGVAFQLADDLLDVTSDAPISGKEPGTDLREGVASLPVLHARRLASVFAHPSGGEQAPVDHRLLELLAGDLADDDLHAEALMLLRASPAVEVARADLSGWADAARATLAPLPDGAPKQALEALCETVVSRTR